MSMLSFSVAGEPQAWQRAGRNRKTGHSYTQKETAVAERSVRASAVWLARSKLEQPLEGPVFLHVRAFFEPSGEAKKKRHPEELRAHGADVDNVGKLVMDALNPPRGQPGVVWSDDRQVSILIAEKWTAAGLELPRTEVMLRGITTEEVKRTCVLCGRGR